MEDYIQRITPQQQLAKMAKAAQAEFVQNEIERTKDLPAGFRYSTINGKGQIKRA
jgi:hypothetical protein